MSLTKTTPDLQAPQTMSPAHSSPLQPITLDAALETHGNDVLPPSSPSAGTPRSPLSPADCRTLSKILQDVRRASSLATPSFSEEDTSSLSIDSIDNESSANGSEDELQYTEAQYDYGDEADEGYEDEDVSMELNDVMEERHGLGDAAEEDAQEGDSIVSGTADESVYVWSDGDTVEDMMNTPGDIAPSAQPQDLSGVYSHDAHMSDEAREINVERDVLEDAVKNERVLQELGDALALADETIDYDPEEQDNAIHLSDDPCFRAVEAVQAETGMSMVTDGTEPSIELEYFEPNDRRTSRQFSPLAIARRASADVRPSYSFITFPDSKLSVASTPGGGHLEFTPNAPVLDMPLTKSLHYLKHHRGKENSPSKSRRNASLPEELAELAREANEEEGLEKYREMDLAPMEPVMESDAAGDLITCSTSSKAHGALMTVRKANVALDTSPEAPPQQLRVSIPHLSLPIEQDESDDADSEYSEAMNCSPEKQLIVYPQHPTFVTVIGLLPKTMFWAAAAPIAKYSIKAYNALVEKIGSLEL